MSKFPLFLLLMILAFVPATPVAADQVVSMQYLGANGATVLGFLASPYLFSIESVLQWTICDDVDHHINPDDSWLAWVASQADLTHAYWGSLPNATQLYGEAFYLGDEMLRKNTASTFEFDQPIIWSLFMPGIPLTTAQQARLAELQTMDLSGSFPDWRVYTDVDGIKQEQLGKVPEPVTMGLIGLGLLGLSLLRRFARR